MKKAGMRVLKTDFDCHVFMITEIFYNKLNKNKLVVVAINAVEGFVFTVSKFILFGTGA